MTRLTLPQCIALLLSLTPVLWAQESRTTKNSTAAATDRSEEGRPAAEKPASPLRRFMDESLSWNELFVDEAATTPMKSVVALRWANNTRGSEDGMTVLYIADGRPEAVCCIYPWQGHLVHHFDSLSRRTLVARRDGQVIWQPRKPGPTFRAVPGADVPGATAAVRVREMKALSEQFSSTMLGWRSDKSDREELRLLPQPLYRYQTHRKDVIDGAVFAFVQGTDPESLLLIEACQGDKSLEWQFAFVRRTSGELDGRHKDIEVWHADARPVQNDPRSTHFAITRALDPDLLDDLAK